jgi:hypothetical protein
MGMIPEALKSFRLSKVHAALLKHQYYRQAGLLGIPSSQEKWMLSNAGGASIPP